AYGYAITVLVGWLVGLGLGALVALALVKMAPVVVVTSHRFQVGRVVLEAQYIGPVTALTRSEAKLLRGVAADARAYVVLRGWIGTAVRIAVDDARDPTPYWFVSTRHPDRLAAALHHVRHGSDHDVTGSNTDPAAH
ncbi:MAG TPA: DUF3093 domain-containing protein, partial [Actinomycetes bacterium]|nr:DUF3093 domain-containing protein [Actinomycetes bacterium]